LNICQEVIGLAEHNYKFSRQHPRDKDVIDIQREIEDNFFSRDKDGNLVIDKDIHCRSIYVEGDSLYIGGIKFISPIHSDNDGYWKYDREVRQFNFNSADEVAVSTGALPSVSAKTAAYTAVFNDFLLCDGTFTVTLPDITSADIGKRVTVCNVGTGMITVDGNGADTIYGETDLECIPNGTFVLMATTTSTWVLG
jgi:hypothetical protein